MNICKIGVFKSWSSSTSTISYLDPCCGEMAEKLIGVDEFRDYNLHAYHHELLEKDKRLNFCSECGGEIEFYDAHEHHDRWEEKFILKIENNSMTLFSACCEDLAVAVRDNRIHYRSSALRLGNPGVSFCFSCGSKLELIDKGMMY